MTCPLPLEDFGRVAVQEPTSVIDGERLEAEKLTAFDKGYAAGWDDATESHKAESTTAERALSARLEELSFTFHEARAHVMRALHPFLTGLVDRIVPQVLTETLGYRLNDALIALADGCPDPDIAVHTNPADAEAVAAHLADHARFPTQIVPDDTLMRGLIQMRLGASAVEIDLTAIETTLRDALAALDDLNKETLSHG